MGITHGYSARLTVGINRLQRRIISLLFTVRLALQKPDLIKVGVWKLIRLGGLIVVFLVGELATGLWAQKLPGSPTSTGVLQDAPASAGTGPSSSSQEVQPHSSASVAGTVRDVHGTLLPGVRVALVGQDNTVERVTTADNNGAFTFAELSAGAYRVKINVAGREPFVSDPVVIGVGESRELPEVALRIATKTTTVDVVGTLNEVAQSQVKEEEKQRIMGFLPNYYTSYIWDAAPMSRKLKFNMALRTATDPITFLVVAGVAGVEQAHKTFPGYGEESGGYAKRYGATYADTVAGRMLGSAIFPAILHQDPRYFYRGSGSIRSRILYALVSTVVCRGDNGLLEPNYSHVLGSFAAAGLSNLYRDPVDRQASLTFRNGLIITGSGAVVNLLREFLSRKLTPNVPTFANGKP
ncbi:MAG: carboxypeptidase-like regulatory domain-containing protein [Acidobacteriota bacterium]|nr:carboxypeptidase-like regulatory domain-containing protein [Acidobacteriota bacterium]